MRLLTLLPLMIGLGFLTACSGGGGESVALETGDVNSGSGTDTSSGNTNSGNDGSSSGNNNTTPPQPTGPQPGEIVAASEPDPQGEYPATGTTFQPAPDPVLEPNSDFIRPIVEIVSQPNPYIAGNSDRLSLQAADNTGGSGLKEISCSMDGGAYSPCGNQLDLSNLSEGLHTVTAYASDWDGNQSGLVSYTFYVDQTPPDVEITQAPVAATQSPNANFSFEALDDGSGVANYQCAINSSALGTCQANEAFQGLNEGPQQLSVAAVDAVGNTSEVTTYNWVVDYSGPQINVINQPPAVVYTGAPNSVVRFDVEDLWSPEGIQNTCVLNGQNIACASLNDITVTTNQEAQYNLVITATDIAGNSSSQMITWQVLTEAEPRTTNLAVGDLRPVDILFVVDNSGSMDFERANLAQRIDGMIQAIDDLDWQISIISTDSSTDDYKSNGRLIELIGMPGQYVLDSTMDTALAQTVFGNTIQGFPSGSPTEEAIYSSRLMIERYLAGEPAQNQFIRQGADLSIVVLSDEDESSDGNGARITPQGFIDFVNNSFNNQKNMVFHSIITRPGDSVCLSGEGFNYGNVYDQLSRLTGYGELGGAIIGSVCEQDYTTQLADIGQSVRDLQNSIELDCMPFDADKDGTPEVMISYRADANQAYAPYTATNLIQGQRVVFDALLPPGDYKVDYQCKIN
jgi:hypothetical protein